MQASIAFYRDVLRFSVLYESTHWTTLDIGNGIRLGLHTFEKGDENAPREGGWVVCVTVDDLVLLRSVLQTAGVWVSETYHDTPAGAIMDFRDPGGNQLQALQLGKSASDLA